MIKIAFLISYIVHNGPSHVVLDLINELDRSKYVPVLVTLISDRNDEEIIYLIKTHTKVIEMDMHNHKDCLIRGRSVFEGKLKQSKIDIVHSHGLIPDVITAIYGKNFLRLSTIHNNPREDYYASYGLLGKYFWAPLHLNVLKKMDYCICCSSSVCDAVKDSLSNCLYVRNGISKHQANLKVDEYEKDVIDKTIFQIPDNSFVFIFAGRLIERKKPVWLVKEFTSYHNEDEFLLIAGDGPLLKACRNIADDHVIFTGFINSIQNFYEIADVYVSASASEGLSISVIEALQKGLALLLSDIPSHRELIEISDECYMGELFQEQDFKKHLNNLRENKSLLDRQKIRNIQQKYLSSVVMTRGYEKIYYKLSSCGTTGTKMT